MKGQTLVEVLVALAIVGIIISAVTVVIVASVNNAKFAINQNFATNYAQQGMEVARQIRDIDVAGFRLYDGMYCLPRDATSLGSSQSSCSQDAEGYVRTVEVEQVPGCSADVAEVSVTVAWADGKCTGNSLCHKVPLVSCLSTVAN